MQPEPALTYTVAQLAEALQIGINAAYRLVKTPGFPRIRNGRETLVPRAALAAWLERQALAEASPRLSFARDRAA